jgi:hypothetical protein
LVFALIKFKALIGLTPAQSEKNGLELQFEMTKNSHKHNVSLDYYITNFEAVFQQSSEMLCPVG